jgi:hypothetical protein
MCNQDNPNNKRLLATAVLCNGGVQSFFGKSVFQSKFFLYLQRLVFQNPPLTQSCETLSAILTATVQTSTEVQQLENNL